MKRMPKVTGFRLVKESEATYQTRPSTQMRWPKDVWTLMNPFAAVELTEVFWILVLDSQHATIGGPIVITRGLLNSSLVHAREVFRPAILLNGAAIILVHNHPSGDPTPSPDDRVVTSSLVSAGKILDIPVQDHIIIGEGRYVSFAESGLL